MVLVYSFLAKDEERRMHNQHPEAYREYSQQTGMFLPRSIETHLLATSARRAEAFLFLAVIVIGGAFLLRWYTVEHLPLWKSSNVVALAIFPEDHPMMDHRMGDMLSLEAIKSRLDANQSYLVYFLAPNYVMQGMIADTGGDWQLYKRHHTVSRFADWVVHPFSHLGGAHASAFEPSGLPHQHMSSGMVRRMIFLKLSAATITKPADAFAIKATRTPDFMADVDVHERRLIDIKTLPAQTAWAKVQTPTF
jgi:hypothetical protein